MTFRSKLLAATAAALATFAAHAADRHYGFDADAQGWSAVSGGAVSWAGTGGNTGGFLQIADATDQDFLVVAPAAALGDWSAFLGGTVSFDARNINGEAPDYALFGLVKLDGAGSTTVSLDLIGTGAPPADGLWHHYEVPLTVAAWGTQLPSVLASVTGFSIGGEFHAGVTEVLGFDNIRVTAVPEPATPALMLAGLVLPGIAALKQRRG
jgi:hypothetical protein